MDNSLDFEIEAFGRMKPELEKHHLDKYVVVKNGELVGAFDTFDNAAKEAVKRFGRGPYLIRQVGREPMRSLPASVLYRPLHASC